MSPEYAMDGAFSVMSDTYSLGVILLEIISGMKITSTHSTSFRNLLAYVSIMAFFKFYKFKQNMPIFYDFFLNWSRHGAYGMMARQWIWWTHPLSRVVYRMKL